MHAQRAADDAADRADFGRTGDLLELRQQIGHVALAQISAQQALFRTRAFQDVVAGQAAADGFEALGRRSHLGFAGGFRQFDHDLLHLNQAGGRA
ncbi:hypothetical protein D3C72_1273710 [compost metagenome]